MEDSVSIGREFIPQPKGKSEKTEKPKKPQGKENDLELDLNGHHVKLSSICSDPYILIALLIWLTVILLYVFQPSL